MPLGTITRDAAESVAGEKVFIDNISFPGDSSYPTGGSPLDDLVKTALGDARDVLAVISGDCGNNICHYVPGEDALGKLLVRVMSTGVEVANAVDLSGTTFNVTVISH